LLQPDRPEEGPRAVLDERLARGCLADIAEQRRLRALATWEEGERFERRLLVSLDALAGLGRRPPRQPGRDSAREAGVVDVRAEAAALAGSTTPDEVFAGVLALACLDDEEAVREAVLAICAGESGRGVVSPCLAAAREALALGSSPAVRDVLE